LIKVLDFDLCAKKYYVSEISSVDDFTYNHYNDGCQMHKQKCDTLSILLFKLFGVKLFSFNNKLFMSVTCWCYKG